MRQVQDLGSRIVARLGALAVDERLPHAGPAALLHEPGRHVQALHAALAEAAQVGAGLDGRLVFGAVDHHRLLLLMVVVVYNFSFSLRPRWFSRLRVRVRVADVDPWRLRRLRRAGRRQPR